MHPGRADEQQSAHDVQLLLQISQRPRPLHNLVHVLEQQVEGSVGSGGQRAVWPPLLWALLWVVVVKVFYHCKAKKR